MITATVIIIMIMIITITTTIIIIIIIIIIMAILLLITTITNQEIIQKVQDVTHKESSDQKLFKASKISQRFLNFETLSYSDRK